MFRASATWFQSLALLWLLPAAAGAPTLQPGSMPTAHADTVSGSRPRMFMATEEAAAPAPMRGEVALPPGAELLVRIGRDAPKRVFPRGESRYRIINLPAAMERAVVEVQVLAGGNPDGRGRQVFKPVLYPLKAGDVPGDPVEFAHLDLDIRPFRRTRLLGCVTVKDLHRFAIATTPDAVGRMYESTGRAAVRAPSQGGFHYATEPLHVQLPFADTGSIVISVKPGKDC